MARFFSIPGMRPHQRDERSRALPDPRDHEQTASFMESRGDTSHGVLGLDPGMRVNFQNRGETVHGEVVAEVPDKSGNVDLYVRAEGNRGHDIYKTHWEPETARTMIQTHDPQKVRKAP